MHDRGDYKTGWQLEKEWDDQQRKKKQALEAALSKMNCQEEVDLANLNGKYEYCAFYYLRS